MKKLDLLKACVWSTWLFGLPAAAAPGEASFTPTSLLVPLQGVRLEGASGPGADLYRCSSSAAPGSLDDAGVEPGSAGLPADPCLVDMADNTALAALFDHAIDVPPGTYDHVAIYLCTEPSRQAYTSYVQGSAELLGDTYYTAGGPNVLTRDQAQQGYVRLDYAGCASSVPLPAPITVEQGQELTVNAFFSLKNIAWAMLGSNGIGGCTQSPGGAQTVCAAYPIPVTYLGDTSPQLDTFYITEDPSDLVGERAGGQLLLLHAQTDAHVFGGFSRRLYSATSVQPSASYDTAIRTVVDNAPAPGYTITTWGGGGSNGGPPQEFYLRFPAFLVATHDGMFERPNGQSSVPYRAVLQP